MATQPIIDRAPPLKMVSLLDWSYRFGVNNAHQADDEGLCRAFIEKCRIRASMASSRTTTISECMNGSYS